MIAFLIQTHDIVRLLYLQIVMAEIISKGSTREAS
jgi:hypothetical protein